MKHRWFWIAGSVAVALIVLAVVGAHFAAQRCELPVVYKSQLGCFEFWLYRYQNAFAALIAILAAAIAWHNVSRQLQVTVASREEDRLQKSLPALRQLNDFLRPIAQHMSGLSRQTFVYAGDTIIDPLIQRTQGLVLEGTLRYDTVDAAVRRSLANIPDDLQREAISAIQPLHDKLVMLKALKAEVTREAADVRDIHKFALGSREAVVQSHKRLTEAYERELDEIAAQIKSLVGAAAGITERIASEELRLRQARNVLEKFF